MPRTPFKGKGDPRNGRGCAKGAPNAGRPKSGIRAAMRKALTERLDVVTTILDSRKATPAQKLAALNLLANYGLGTRQPTRRVELTGKDGGPVETKQTLVFGDKEIVF